MFVVAFAKSLAHLALYVFVSKVCRTCRHFGLVLENPAVRRSSRLRWTRRAEAYWAATEVCVVNPSKRADRKSRCEIYSREVLPKFRPPLSVGRRVFRINALSVGPPASPPRPRLAVALLRSLSARLELRGEGSARRAPRTCYVTYLYSIQHQQLSRKCAPRQLPPPARCARAPAVASVQLNQRGGRHLPEERILLLRRPQCERVHEESSPEKRGRRVSVLPDDDDVFGLPEKEEKKGEGIYVNAKGGVIEPFPCVQFVCSTRGPLCVRTAPLLLSPISSPVNQGDIGGCGQRGSHCFRSNLPPLSPSYTLRRGTDAVSCDAPGTRFEQPAFAMR
ncbi:hypothetical protein HPB51_003920 [Rhipicephalus microplus]|uniref:Secreted protein n=1 Tax=Rhipicephalus microplus TaxID=6941 RepID=A0A9J6ER69_RHIMP|nr:hypothetical protein HPB51_003920 [Rhipicephalus microplus]